MENKQISIGRSVMEKPIHVDSLDTLLYFEFNDKFRDKPEAHPAWEMVYADRGECTIVADDASFPLRQGELYFHKPFERHMLQIPPNDFPNIIIISFVCDSPAMRFFEGRRLAASLSVKQQIATILNEATQTLDITNPRLRIQGAGLRPKSKLWAGEESILLRFELLLIELIRENTAEGDRRRLFLSKELASDPLCVSVIEYLEEHVGEKPDAEALCRQVNFSRSHVSRHFQKICGIPLGRYFNMMKIERAKVLIRQTNMSFTEISERLALSNSHYFSTLFRSHVGMTPSQYKKSCK